MKNLNKIAGIRKLNKKEQQTIKGGVIYKCVTEADCPIGYGCLRGICVWGV